MVKTPFNLLTIRPQNRYKNQGFKMKENTGLDTETYQGYVKLICDDKGKYKFVDDFSDVLQFLTHERYRNKFNWFYNIQFDFESVIKYLDRSDLTDLYMNGTLEIDTWEISYIAKKYFSIRGKKNQYFYFYDMYNFLDTSLDKASKQFLNDEKLKIVDSSLLNTDLDYWKKHEKDILKYCIYDAQLTKRLADYFWNIIYTNLHYYPKRPFSKGKLSEEYFLTNCYVPQVEYIPLKVIEYAYNSYFGGRFELLKRGFFESVYAYDIKSAYPSQIANLIDFTKGTWKKETKLNEDSYTGFYLCEIDSLEPFFSPVVKKIKELNIYPNGRFKQYLSKDEILYINAHFENTRCKIVNGYGFYPKKICNPFKKEIERLYNWKEKEKNEDIKYAVKIILNALYGKFIQVNDGNTGKLFNPLYASLITSKTRLKLFELAYQKPDAIIAFSTDSITSIEKLKTPKNPKLGDFSKDFEGKGVFILSDVYTLWNEKKNKNKLRGFSLTVEKDNDSDVILLKDILKNLDKTIYKYSTSRPYHLGECLTHYKKLDIKKNLNVFSNVPKNINVNGDMKRVWERNFKSGKECLECNINSIPILV